MSSIEKAIERFKKSTKYGSDKLDIDFALADTADRQHYDAPENIVEDVVSPEVSNDIFSDKKRDASSFEGSRPRYSFDYTALSQQGF
ncbi:MAG: hypothetical protein ACC707_09105, partial [Thiohalomonadales bacterium]